MRALLILVYMATAAIYDICSKKLPLWLMLIFSAISIILTLLLPEIEFNILAFIPGIFMLIISIISNHSLGLGDSILILTLGLLLSITELISIILFSLFFASLAGVILFVKNRNKKQAIPFVPFILLSYLLLSLI